MQEEETSQDSGADENKNGQQSAQADKSSDESLANHRFVYDNVPSFNNGMRR